MKFGKIASERAPLIRLLIELIVILSGGAVIEHAYRRGSVRGFIAVGCLLLLVTSSWRSIYNDFLEAWQYSPFLTTSVLCSFVAVTYLASPAREMRRTRAQLTALLDLLLQHDDKKEDKLVEYREWGYGYSPSLMYTVAFLFSFATLDAAYGFNGRWA